MNPDFEISERFARLPTQEVAGLLSGRALELLQGEAFFHLAYAQQRRRRDIVAKATSGGFKRVLISNNLRGLIAAGWGAIEYLDRGFFASAHPASDDERALHLRDAIVIVNNNDAHEQGGAERYTRLFERCNQTLFIAWDWDNHHWLALSPVLAAHCDLYVPTHPENLYPLSRFNAATSEPVAAGAVQWTADFLRANRELILHAMRSNDPLGKHIPYSAFQYRLRTVATLQPHFPSIGFSSHQFHAMTAEQKLNEWCAYKLHWIVPVLNDLPIRIFDAWVSGGIPIVPESLRCSRWLADAHADDIVFYSAADIVDPQPLVARAVSMFDADAENGIARRFEFGLTRHHGDVRIAEILAIARRYFGIAGLRRSP